MNTNISGFIFVGSGPIMSIDNNIQICETNNTRHFQKIMVKLHNNITKS